MTPMLQSRSFRMHRLSRWLPLILLPLLASCATTVGPATVKPDLCAGWSPIYPSKADVLTDGTAKQVLAHDLHGVAEGCWKAPLKPTHPTRVQPSGT